MSHAFFRGFSTESIDPRPPVVAGELLVRNSRRLKHSAAWFFATMPEEPALGISTQCAQQISTRLWKERSATFLRDSEAE
jgi:hypothetical protein